LNLKGDGNFMNGNAEREILIIMVAIIILFGLAFLGGIIIIIRLFNI